MVLLQRLIETIILFFSHCSWNFSGPSRRFQCSHSLATSTVAQKIRSIPKTSIDLLACFLCPPFYYFTICEKKRTFLADLYGFLPHSSPNTRGSSKRESSTPLLLRKNLAVCLACCLRSIYSSLDLDPCYMITTKPVVEEQEVWLEISKMRQVGLCRP